MHFVTNMLTESPEFAAPQGRLDWARGARRLMARQKRKETVSVANRGREYQQQCGGVLSFQDQEQSQRWIKDGGRAVEVEDQCATGMIE